MARRIIIGEILNLIKGLGGNPNKFMGTKTNISFLGRGPQESLFQGAIDIEGMIKAGYPLEGVIREAETAGGYVTSGKLNDLQLQRLRDNLFQLKQVYKPEQLANITDMATGTGDLTQEGLGSLRAGLGRFPKETHKFFGRPLKEKDFIEIEKLAKEGKLGNQNPEVYGNVEPGSIGAKAIDESINRYPGLKYFESAELAEKTHSARATLLRLLDASATEGGQTLREIMAKKDLKWLLEGGGGAEGDPIALFAKYFGAATTKQLPSAGTPAVIEEFAKKVIQRKDKWGRTIDDPFFKREDIDFAGGGLAHILQVPRSGYSKGRLVKGALAILNRNKKNAEYMFKASDNVSPGYARGDMKYNAELLADQLAEDAGVVYNDLGDLERIKFYGTAYDYLAKEMGMMLRMQKDVKNMVQIDALKKWDPTGRKPSASGGLARILEV